MLFILICPLSLCNVYRAQIIAKSITFACIVYFSFFFFFFYFDEKSVMSIVFCNVIMVLLSYVHACLCIR